MRVLLDEQLPHRFARELMGIEVRTVQQEGWAGAKNGDLLRRAVQARFHVFLTSDQNLRFQQNLRGVPIAVIVLVARSNVLEALIPLVPGVRDAISRSRPGDCTLVGPIE